jgi:glycosyltransferase involved in cell wall biosynthesis
MTNVEDQAGRETPAPLRVLMVAPTSFFGHYGGHIRILEEVRALQALGHHVTITTYYKGENVAGVDIERTWPLPWHADYEVGSSRHKLAFDFFLGLKVSQVGWRYRPHIVHGHMHEGALLGSVVARTLRVPLVFDFQGSLTGEMLDHNFIRRGSMGHRFWRGIERTICRLPDAILTSSERAERLLESDFAVPGSRIVPLPDCADLAHFSRQRVSSQQLARLRARFGIPSERPVVAYLGLLADYQGTPDLVRAAALLKAQDEDVHFLIMGYPNEDRYRAMAAHLGVADRVTLTGRVDYMREAPSFLALGTIAVSPKSSTSEGSGKVLNYMALGQAVVAYDSPVHREYMGEGGVYVPKGSVTALAAAIADLLHDDERRQRLGRQLRERAARHYSWEQAAERIDEVYARLLQQKSVRIAKSV